MKLIVGLGNPGPQYRDTRHNLGFMVADALAETLGVAFTRVQDGAEVTRTHFAGGPVMIAKPMTFMNLSGRAVAAIARRQGCSAEDVLVMVDDRHLPLGAVRLRTEGSAGGHNGLKSIIAEMGVSAFHRMRLGIGGQEMPGDNLSAFVLARFSSEERRVVVEVVQRAAEAALCWLEAGMAQAMNRFNARGDKEG